MTVRVMASAAVVHFPTAGHTTRLAQPVDPKFTEELRSRGIRHHAGECLVDAAAADAPGLLDVIGRLEQAANALTDPDAVPRMVNAIRARYDVTHQER